MTPQLQIGSQWRGVGELSLACIARTVKIQSSIFFATISMMLLCSGCIPYHFTTRPGASGVVLDARTGVPIVGAAVSVAPVRGDDPAGTATTETDGSFRVPPRRQWGVYLVPGDVFPFPFTLSVQHEGYQQTVVQFAHRAMGEGTTTNFGEVRIKNVTEGWGSTNRMHRIPR